MSKVFKNLFEYAKQCENEIIQTPKQLERQKKFIEKAKGIHGDKYDYSDVVYINAQTKICIICPTHGEFWQRPHNHVNIKQGCAECAKLKSMMTTDEFKNKANKIQIGFL